MPLFKVEFTMVAVIQANDSDTASQIARDEWRDISRDDDPGVLVVDEIASLHDLPEGWDGMCLPYGGDGDTRLKDVLPDTPLTTEPA